VGTIVYGIPVGSHPMMINGVTYYEYNGAYYTSIPGGYQVVQPPIIYQATAPVVVQSAAAVTTTDTPEGLTVNIPDSKGGYTAVTLKRSGTGFVGPQGEFYPEFPKVEQLRVMYANK